MGKRPCARSIANDYHSSSTSYKAMYHHIMSPSAKSPASLSRWYIGIIYRQEGKVKSFWRLQIPKWSVTWDLTVACCKCAEMLWTEWLSVQITLVLQPPFCTAARGWLGFHPHDLSSLVGLWNQHSTYSVRLHGTGMAQDSCKQAQTFSWCAEAWTPVCHTDICDSTESVVQIIKKLQKKIWVCQGCLLSDHLIEWSVQAGCRHNAVNRPWVTSSCLILQKESKGTRPSVKCLLPDPVRPKVHRPSKETVPGKLTWLQIWKGKREKKKEGTWKSKSI